ncbi:PTS sugar transporter subunit IIC [Streptobacillus moniliformis]|uniref:Phosphotransferase system PTS sorbose-specific IIC subunit n=1 Tax=Streptobacillus moniliformis (strain ATCC 14647 / DSM 12112 / NCTC 10651 / 9901) TaxID=519441 RepID=D1AWG6_STRM9|nr:PTS N-acetylgalactosamine transporter subunit IIC [Streptobacillus moniliformis]ACZ00642.1 phosphotransferase system PTS sorbose-specific IIC subunit [Streptobacillus moniliformis DSM 12112]AVL42947.1 PTS sugar transporter subunit IIC [Streptobacillus moniliformis]QXW65408.1 PTS sugar transporter subunit IIC [Streptobacillus moniliformis]SQA14230.1 PTS system N-acetylgalactosamine-specific EIIC component 1 [Streptobacillus moniliformis]
MLLKAILIAIWAGFAGIEQFDGLQTFHRPIFAGLVIGLILGDVKTGLMVGGSLELVWMGLVPLAGAQPPNIVVGGVFGVSLALLSGLQPQEAIGIVFPLAVIGQIIVTLMFSLYSGMMKLGDKAAENANPAGVDRLVYIQLLIRFVLFGGVTFLFVYFGSDSIKSIIESIPQYIIDGFGKAGSMMPAIGFALLLNIMLKKEYFSFLIVGFVATAYLKLDLVAVTLIAVSIALYDYYSNSSKAIEVVRNEEEENGI